ncbi:ATP-binding protein [Stappia taiwanensis]|uniref:ATP-binding protein n=1 Tax=Stappia taiwanensis TaxID=992267 RepID=A0A838XUY5_9HYPH|nr:ATP-binding protein [Stappia taiwanensis]MBA4610793.1 ATP-binding protein [Stappia taiwanensis]GGE95822.1 ATP-binding protein [Stappia taiwanensis]
MTVSIDMGEVTTGGGLAGADGACLDLEELLATRLLVQGNSGSGKSHLLRRLLEQSAAWVQQAVIDPEGDFVTLADRFGHVVIDAAASERDLAVIAARVRAHRVSVVLNLEGLEPDRQMKAAATFLNAMFEAERDHWYPMLVVVDEAQLFAPAASGDTGEDARRVSLGAMTNLMCRGRKRGLAGVIATQRLAKLAKNVAAEASNFLMGRTFLDIDMARAADLLGMEKRQAEAFRNLDRGHFVALGPAISRRPLTIRIGQVETAGRGGGPKLTPLPQARPEEVRDLLFQPASREERTAVEEPKPQPVMPASEVLDRLTRQAAAREVVEAEPLDLEAREKAIDAVIAELLSDGEAAFQPVAALYQDFLVRCRIARLAGKPPELADFRQRVAMVRAGVEQHQIDPQTWATAETVAQNLPEEMRGVYLLLAKAALEGGPCPPDAEIARAYGTRSPGRARWLLTHMEEQGYIVCVNDLRGNRIVTLTDLDCQTSPPPARAVV